MKKILTYFSFGLLILRGVLWYSGHQLRNDLYVLRTEAENLSHQADSLRALRALAFDDSIAVTDLKRKEKQLLTDALNKQLTARDKANSQLMLLDNLELTSNILLGLALASLVVMTVKAIKLPRPTKL